MIIESANCNTSWDSEQQRMMYFRDGSYWYRDPVYVDGALTYKDTKREEVVRL